MSQQYQVFISISEGYQNNIPNQNANYNYRNYGQEPLSGPTKINEDELKSTGPQPIDELNAPEIDESKITWVTLRNCSLMRMVQFLIICAATYVCYLKYDDLHPLFDNNVFGGIEIGFIVLAFVIYYAEPQLEKGNIAVAGFLLYFIVTVAFCAFFCGLGLQEGTKNSNQLFFISIFLGSTAFADLIFAIVIMASKENYNIGIISLIAVIVLGAEYISICAFAKVDWGNCGYAFLGVIIFVGYFVLFYTKMKKSQKDKYNNMFYAAAKCCANIMTAFAMCFVYPIYWCYKSFCPCLLPSRDGDRVSNIIIISEYTFI